MPPSLSTVEVKYDFQPYDGTPGETYDIFERAVLYSSTEQPWPTIADGQTADDCDTASDAAIYSASTT